MTLKQFAVVFGCVSVGAGGVYYAVQLEKLAGLEYEENKVKRNTDTYNKQLQGIDTDLQETSALLKTLEQQAEVERRSSAAIRIQLEAARREVVGLEAELLGKEAQIRLILQGASGAQEKMKALRQEVFRTKEKLSMGERQLAQVRERVAETKTLLNPLNHPTVKDLFNRK